MDDQSDWIVKILGWIFFGFIALCFIYPLVEDYQEKQKSKNQKEIQTSTLAQTREIQQDPINSYTPVITGKKSKITYEQINGFNMVMITVQLKNNSDKTISKVYISVIFKNKLFNDPNDYTSPVQVENCKSEINIPPRSEAKATFGVLEPSDINMTYYSAKIERVLYSDGSVVNLQ